MLITWWTKRLRVQLQAILVIDAPNWVSFSSDLMRCWVIWCTRSCCVYSRRWWCYLMRCCASFMTNEMAPTCQISPLGWLYASVSHRFICLGRLTLDLMGVASIVFVSGNFKSSFGSWRGFSRPGLVLECPESSRNDLPLQIRLFLRFVSKCIQGRFSIIWFDYFGHTVCSDCSLRRRRV